jgi:hypothetical protein
MPGSHALLAPSAAERWMICPGSARLESTLPNSGSEAADQGTACHRMLESYLRNGTQPATWLGQKVQIADEENGVISTVEVTNEMIEWVEEACDWVDRYIAGHPGAHLMSEERLHVGRAFGCPDDLWGTSDVVIDAGTELVIIDLKAGRQDVRVAGNPQLLLYSIGAMQEYGWVHEQVRNVILQPRSGGAKEEVYSRAQIEDARKRFAPKVAAALSLDAPYVVSDEGCKWCSAAGVCPTLHSQSVALAQREFADAPAIVSKEQLVTLLSYAARIRAVLTAAERHALKLIQSGVELPGWKVVQGDKRDAWKEGQDNVALVVLETEHGADADKIAPRKLRTPNQVAGEIEKGFPGKTKKERTAAALVFLKQWYERPKGEPILVPESDDRAPMLPEFSEEP